MHACCSSYALCCLPVVPCLSCVIVSIAAQLSTELCGQFCELATELCAQVCELACHLVASKWLRRPSFPLSDLAAIKCEACPRSPVLWTLRLLQHTLFQTPSNLFDAPIGVRGPYG